MPITHPEHLPGERLIVGLLCLLFVAAGALLAVAYCGLAALLAGAGGR